MSDQGGRDRAASVATRKSPPPSETVETQIVELADGLRVHAISAVDARFLHREIFEFTGYGDISLPESPFVVDVGANIGMFILKTKMSRPHAEVMAFEPMPALAEAARRTVKLNSLTGVTVHQVALGENRQSNAVFHYYPLWPSSSTRFPQRHQHQRENVKDAFPHRLLDRMFQSRDVTVEIARLSDYLPDRRPIDLLKIDTSGSELETLAGIDPHHRPLIRRLVLDVHDRDGRAAAVRDLLAGWDMTVRVRPAPMAGEGSSNVVIHAEPEGI